MFENLIIVAENNVKKSTNQITSISYLIELFLNIAILLYQLEKFRKIK